jgi:hypothetical protein
MRLAPAMFGLFSFTSDEHGSNESVCDCRNKTAAIVLKLLEHFLGHKHTRVGLFHEVKKKQTFLGLHML